MQTTSTSFARIVAESGKIVTEWNGCFFICECRFMNLVIDELVSNDCIYRTWNTVDAIAAGSNG
jgi:hypothetical protein